MFHPMPLFTIAAAGLLCSCATERTITTKLPNSQERSMTEDERNKMAEADLMDRFAGGFGMKRDKDGTSKIVSEKRSSFEGQRYDGNTSEVERKAFETKAFDKKEFADAKNRFDTKTWDGAKSFTDGKMDTPAFITQAKGVETRSWQEASKQYATRTAEQQGLQWSDAGKKMSYGVNQDIEAKRKSFTQPNIINARESQARTIQETREMMGRTD